MMNFQSAHEIRQAFAAVGAEIRSGAAGVEPHRVSYGLGLAHGVCQAIHCGYDRISTAEFGVAHGGGLLNLCRAADYLMGKFDVKINVYGFDNAAGLPEPKGYKDHPEIWRRGDFTMPDREALRAQLPGFARLIVGDVGDTVATFEADLKSAPLGFASIDLDYYSSTKRVMPLFAFDPLCYVPATPVFFDDVFGLITMNRWAGEELAIHEFNKAHELRKLEQKTYNVHPQLHILHVFDHPVRTGAVKPLYEFEIWPF